MGEGLPPLTLPPSTLPPSLPLSALPSRGPPIVDSAVPDGGVFEAPRFIDGAATNPALERDPTEHLYATPARVPSPW
jgi:hypothetical protein